MSSDNPAARLLAILEKGRNHSPSENCLHVWQSLLNVGQNNQALLMKRLGKVMELPDEILGIIETQHPNQLKAQAHWKSSVGSAFTSQNLVSNWASFISHIDEHTISFLNMTNALITNSTNIESLPEDKLVEIRDEVNELISKVIESDANDDFKKQISYYLHKILIAIDEYHISGSSAITESLEGTLGHAFLDKNYRETMKNNKIGKDILSVMTGIATAISVVNGIPSLEGSIQYLLSLNNS